jgi:hypothetical protein
VLRVLVVLHYVQQLWRVASGRQLVGATGAGVAGAAGGPPARRRRLPYLGEVLAQADTLLLAALRPRAASLRGLALLRRDLLVRVRALWHENAATDERRQLDSEGHREKLKRPGTAPRTSKSSSSASASTPTSSVASLSSLLIRFSRMRCLSASLAREMLDDTADLRFERRASIPSDAVERRAFQSSPQRSRRSGLSGSLPRVPGHADLHSHCGF